MVGSSIDRVEIAQPGDNAWTYATWGEVTHASRRVGAHTLKLTIAASAAPTVLQIPHCAGRGRITFDGGTVVVGDGPVIIRLAPGVAHEVRIDIAVSAYERRIACGEAPRVGALRSTDEGLSVLSFASPSAAAGGGRAVVFVPPGLDPKKAAPLLVGVHPWNGTMWTYAAYAELVREAAARGVVLLMPSGLGNSLYTARAEDEVLRAMDAVLRELPIDPRRVSIWGASMGGQGATTIGLHHPDKFAAITSYFGDARFDIGSYVRFVLPTEAEAHKVNPIDVIDNARHVPIWLVHGEADRTSPIRESEELDRALRARGYAVRFDRAPGMGHEGALVVRHIAEVVDNASVARSPATPPRVTFRSVRSVDTEAYGVRIVRAGEGDAFVDLELRKDGVHVLRASGVRAISLRKGALGAPEGTPIVREPGVVAEARWDGE